jgi:hypothetical protein
MQGIRLSRTVGAAALLAALAACGGGGGDDAGAPAAANPPSAAPTATTPTPSIPPPPAPTGNAVIGKTLWGTKVTGVGLSCEDCHGAPVQNINNVLNGAAGYEVIAGRIQAAGSSMAIFQGKLSVSQMQDLSAYLRNPTL